MAEFLKSLSNTVIVAVTILSVVGIFFKKLDPFNALVILGILLFLGLISLIIYYVNRLENKIDSTEQKFKRADDLVEIKSDISALKLNLSKRK